MPSPLRVLVVDRSQESRELLSTLLARCGAEVLEARTAARAVELAAVEQLDLIVADVDASPAHSSEPVEGCIAGSSETRMAEAAALNGAPVVFLGTIRRGASPYPAAEYVAKPYHYRALIRRIEELLEHRACG